MILLALIQGIMLGVLAQQAADAFSRQSDRRYMARPILPGATFETIIGLAQGRSCWFFWNMIQKSLLKDKFRLRHAEANRLAAILKNDALYELAARRFLRLDLLMLEHANEALEAAEDAETARLLR